MKSLAERLEEAFTYHAESVERCDPAGMADARCTIHRIYMECVPNEFSHNDKNDEAGCSCDWIEGYNDCRTETLKKMEELRK